ncbi:hypothetical protein HDU82_000868, partial [Entophlyctis luteolus]
MSKPHTPPPRDAFSHSFDRHDESGDGVAKKDSYDDGDEDLAGFDVEAQIALELSNLLPDDDQELLQYETSNPNNNTSTPSFRCETVDQGNDLTCRRVDDVPLIEIAQGCFITENVKPATSAEEQENPKPMRLTTPDVSGRYSRQSSIMSDTSASVKSWTELIANIQNRDNEIENQKHQIELQVDEALGFLNRVSFANKGLQEHDYSSPAALNDLGSVVATFSNPIDFENNNTNEGFSHLEVRPNSDSFEDETAMQIISGFGDGAPRTPNGVGEFQVHAYQDLRCSQVSKPETAEVMNDENTDTEAALISEMIMKAKEKFDSSMQLSDFVLDGTLTYFVASRSLDESLESESELLEQLRREIEQQSRRGTAKANTEPTVDIPAGSMRFGRRGSVAGTGEGGAGGGPLPGMRRASSIIVLPDFSGAIRSAGTEVFARAGAEDVARETLTGVPTSARGFLGIASRGRSMSVSSVERGSTGDMLSAMQTSLSRRSSNVDGSTDWDARRASISSDSPEADDEVKAYKKEERRLKLELQQILGQTKEELARHEELSLASENLRSHVMVQHRAVRTIKMAIRDHEQQYRQLLYWLQVVAKVAFEKEKDKANALLQRSAKIFEKFKKAQDKVSAKASNNTQKLKSIVNQLNSAFAESQELNNQENSLSKEVERLKQQLESEEKLLESRKLSIEAAVSKRLQIEEANRLLEKKVIERSLRRKDGAGNLPATIEELEYLEANDSELEKIPYLKDAIRLLYANFDGNNIANLRGLDYVKSLNVVSFNRNKLNELDLSSLGDIKFFSGNSNQISRVEVNQLWKMSTNKMEGVRSREILSLAGSEHCIENVPNLIYLDLSRTKVSSGTPPYLANCKVLQYLSLARNRYSEIPAFENLLLHILDMAHNFLSHVKINCWFPRLKILRLNGNKIEKVYPLSYCPFLVELQLADNHIEDPANLIALTVCQQLQILNLAHNPVTSWADFDTFCYWNFDQLKMLDEFMGPEYEPYLDYLQGPQDATLDMRLMLQASRLQWLVGALTSHLSELTRVNTFASPNSLNWATKNHEDDILDELLPNAVKQSPQKPASSQRARRASNAVHSRETSQDIAVKELPARLQKRATSPRIEDEVVVLFSQQAEDEQGWITNTEKNEALHHEELSVNTNAFETDLVNFNPLKDYLQKVDKSSSMSVINSQEALTISKDSIAQNRQYWIQKAAHERMMAAKASKYVAGNDPLARLRKFYQHAYVGAPIASLALKRVVTPDGVKYHQRPALFEPGNSAVTDPRKGGRSASSMKENSHRGLLSSTARIERNIASPEDERQVPIIEFSTVESRAQHSSQHVNFGTTDDLGAIPVYKKNTEISNA